MISSTDAIVIFSNDISTQCLLSAKHFTESKDCIQMMKLWRNKVFNLCFWQSVSRKAKIAIIAL
uniref:Uncharacterized protein n=1 Tax=Spodoptera frugiperda nuclear polyhedrosis virus TaxID=10455 RepID=E9L632_NPVSF|nr:hypothetical protein Sf39a [Spodoptera frugiperda multiple nucleopolyhedrovirus]AFH58990.1 hypothetical protein Sf39a [Spodoptera frugiperda multiple nucleopolyhedrovirus]